MHVTQKYYISIKSEEKVPTIKKGKQFAIDICSFCLIFAYRLKPVLLCISVGQMPLFLFELYVNRSYMDLVKMQVIVGS